jgi:hypothetical protein
MLKIYNNNKLFKIKFKELKKKKKKKKKGFF